MPRQIIIAGNWKMYKTSSEAKQFAQTLQELLPNWEGCEVWIAPSYTSLIGLKKHLPSYVQIGAQNMHYEDEGAFTGEVSSKMLKELEVHFVIVGHSERRTQHKETDALVNKKILKALSSGLLPILCVGETLEERQNGVTEEVLQRQIKKGLESLDNKAVKNIIIAYEPVWAIGTGVAATPEEAQKAHKFCRSVVEKEWGKEAATNVRIIYGGSVKFSNAYNLLHQNDIDGALIGGAALDAGEFANIIKLTKQVVE